MAGQVVQMDYQVIQQVSNGFKQQAQALRTVARVLEAAIQILQTMAFLSGGTTKALARYLTNIKNKVQKLAGYCEEFAGDLARAISDHQKGDVKGKSYFGEGVRR
jgi:flagellar motor switch protein FliG